ncbi:MAG: DUF1351 domain-containing protein [Provencibacterium sp.]|jgi:hypothetical protein|nr:DUF1351 domain-containing protein [Provencibacterium sp.]
MNELIVIKQLPVIEEQLQAAKGQVEARVAEALSLACTEDTVKTVKAARAELNKEFQTFEERRKDVKRQILTPYERFEAVYAACISGPYKSADEQLKTRIAEVEDSVKAQKREAVAAYYQEYCMAKAIDFIPFERAGIAVTLSASLKKLKEQAKDFLDKVSDELALIATQEHADEILLEYRKSLNVAQAIQMVSARHRALEEERQRREQARAAAHAREQAARKVEEAAAPPAALPPVQRPIPAEAPQQPAPEKKYRMAFTVTDTVDRLKALKKFLEDGGYQYE